MRTTLFLTIATALTISAPLAAKTETTANSQLAENKSGKAAEGEKKICKRLSTSGTRMADRVCLTKEQWKKVDEETNG